MLLETVGWPGMLDAALRGATFAMEYEGEIVSVLVTHAALDDIGSEPVTEGDALLRLENYRGEFEALANEIFKLAMSAPRVIIIDAGHTSVLREAEKPTLAGWRQSGTRNSALSSGDELRRRIASAARRSLRQRA